MRAIGSTGREASCTNTGRERDGGWVSSIPDRSEEMEETGEERLLGMWSGFKLVTMERGGNGICPPRLFLIIPM